MYYANKMVTRSSIKNSNLYPWHKQTLQTFLLVAKVLQKSQHLLSEDSFKKMIITSIIKLEEEEIDDDEDNSAILSSIYDSNNNINE